PNGNRYVGFDVYFAIYGTTRLVVVANNPTPGTWTAEVKALTPLGNEAGNFLAFPDRVHEKITAFFFDPPAIADIAGHPARGAIEFALANGFMGLCGTGTFCPDQPVTRAQFARGYTQFGAIRQSLPLGGGSTFGDVSAADKPFVEAVAARGAALRDLGFRYNGVMEGGGTSWYPNGGIIRQHLAKMLVRGVGGEQAALDHTGDVTYLYNGQRYVIADQDQIDPVLRGYVQVAINSNMFNVFAEVVQGPYDLQPTLKFYFRPNANLTRADAAVAISRYHTQYFAR
ncbi:MAG TPA: S-layer homology domain-containing protein, partial [Longimicrobiaceae bacterium]|nr:S-layer homology domain-containing protein [Longimicrobiaceae bacterium]